MIAVSVLCLLALPAQAATFGTRVVIGGQAADIALDEARGVVYVANYTASRIDVVDTKTLKITNSINVAAQPAALALSPDGRYLVITHLSNFGSTTGTSTAKNGLTVLDLSGNNNRQTFSFGDAPLGVAFGNDGLALIATTGTLMLFDPATGYSTVVTSIANITTKTLPVPVGQFPRDIVRASVSASGDGSRIYGVLEANNSSTTQLEFRYDVANQSVTGVYWTSKPASGPRVISVDKTGSRYISGWAMHHVDGYQLAQFPNAAGDFAKGSHVFDSARQLLYAQVSMSSAFQVWPQDPSFSYNGPVLMVADWDNLNVREQLKLTENLSGRSVLNSDGSVMYSVSDSGLMVLPVGTLASTHRVAASQEAVVFRGSFCDRSVQSQQISIVNPGGGNTDFTLSADESWISFSPSSGTTPAVVKVSVDPTAVQNIKGTYSTIIRIRSGAGVNITTPISVVVNNREPDQRGTFFSVPGKLVDVLADPVRNKFYVLRQDKNQVLVFDGTSYKQLATLRTGNTPWSMAMTFDKKYLIVGADNSQVAHVFDLDTLKFAKYIVFPGGHYPRWIAASGNAILAACRYATGANHGIDRVQMYGTATALPSLGVFENKIDVNTALVPSPSGNSILVAMADGSTLLYDAAADTFIAARKDFDSLSGAVAALSDESFAVDNHILNASLVESQTLEASSGASSGFAMVDGLGLRTTAPNSASPGVIQRINLTAPLAARPTRMTEAPVLADAITGSAFVRTLAPLANRNAIVSLSTSGFVALPWAYDTAVADPHLVKVVNAADGSSAVAPGGLISIIGTDLSPVNAAANQIPLPTLLGDSCLTVNGVLVPMVLVSPTKINGQLPVNVADKGTMILRTPAGISNTLTFPIQSTAPSVFRVDIAGWDTQMPTVVRAANNLPVTPSNPVHTDDWLVIYTTGLGLTTPGVDSGMPGPSDDLAKALVEPTVTLGGADLPLAFAGLVPGEVGVYQINVKVPFKNVKTGMEVPLTINQGGGSTTLNVRVVD